MEVLFLKKKCNILALIFGIIAVAAAVTATVAGILLFFEKKKKDEEELEHYLDCSIQ
jgi:glucose uptake protein GlcU